MGLFVLPIGVLFTAAVAILSHLRRFNQVAPGAAVGATPLTWLWSPGWAATLHRRLRSAAALAGAVAGPSRRRRWRRGRALPTDTITDLAREVVGEAMRLDRELVAANLTSPGAARTQALSALDHEVRGIEDAAHRVHRLAAQRARLNSSGVHALSLNERIASMEAAMRELNAGPRPFN